MFKATKKVLGTIWRVLANIGGVLLVALLVWALYVGWFSGDLSTISSKIKFWPSPPVSVSPDPSGDRKTVVRIKRDIGDVVEIFDRLSSKNQSLQEENKILVEAIEQIDSADSIRKEALQKVKNSKVNLPPRAE
jgi:hypothetical protein